MSYEQETEKLLNEIPNKSTGNKTRSVTEKVRARKRGNAGNHPKYSQEDRLAAINKLIDGE